MRGEGGEEEGGSLVLVAGAKLRRRNELPITRSGVRSIMRIMPTPLHYTLRILDPSLQLLTPHRLSPAGDNRIEFDEFEQAFLIFAQDQNKDDSEDNDEGNSAGGAAEDLGDLAGDRPCRFLISTTARAVRQCLHLLDGCYRARGLAFANFEVCADQPPATAYTHVCQDCWKRSSEAQDMAVAASETESSSSAAP